MNTWETANGTGIIQLLSGRSNVFLISKNGSNVMVDTSSKGSWKRLDRKLERLNIDRLDCLILTHTHYDHSENSAKLKEKYKALLIVHKEEASCISGGRMTIPKGTNLFTKLVVKLLAKPFSRKIVRCDYDILVESNYDLNPFGINGYIMHTPGHSPGSMSVIIDDEIAIVGDTMFGVFKWSAFPPYADDTKELIHSWKKLLQTNCRVFLPSHGTADSRNLLQKEYNKRTAFSIT